VIMKKKRRYLNERPQTKRWGDNSVKLYSCVHVNSNAAADLGPELATSLGYHCTDLLVSGFATPCRNWNCLGRRPVSGRATGDGIWPEYARLDLDCLHHHYPTPAYPGISADTAGFAGGYITVVVTIVDPVDPFDDGIHPTTLDVLGPGINQHVNLALVIYNTA
jgi:hypothetical protein